MKYDHIVNNIVTQKGKNIYTEHRDRITKQKWNKAKGKYWTHYILLIESFIFFVGKNVIILSANI